MTNLKENPTIVNEKFGPIHGHAYLPQETIDRVEKYINNVNQSFQKAEKLQSKLPDEILNMEGMSGKKTRHFYNNLLEMDDSKYLEIGTWRGSSVCSAMYGNKALVVCNDNWSLFGGPKDEFIENFNKFKGENEATFIEQDSFTLDVQTLPKFNIYLYDGDHFMESHEKALTHFYDCLEDIFIFICDDWNGFPVREATFNAFKKCNFNILYEISITNDAEGTNRGFGSDGREGWWNGTYVSVIQKVTPMTFNRGF